MKLKLTKHHLRNLCSDFVKDERGQSTTEYILILSVVVMIAMKFKGVLKEQVLGKLMGDVERDMESFSNSD